MNMAQSFKHLPSEGHSDVSSLELLKTCGMKTHVQVFFFFSINLFFIEGQLLYRIWLFSVKPQHESAIGIHISPPF